MVGTCWSPWWTIAHQQIAGWWSHDLSSADVGSSARPRWIGVVTFLCDCGWTGVMTWPIHANSIQLVPIIAYFIILLNGQNIGVLSKKKANMVFGAIAFDGSSVSSQHCGWPRTQTTFRRMENRHNLDWPVLRKTLKNNRPHSKLRAKLEKLVASQHFYMLDTVIWNLGALVVRYVPNSFNHTPLSVSHIWPPWGETPKPARSRCSSTGKWPPGTHS